MLVIVGLIVLFVAGIVAIVGVLSNAGAGHPPTENFRVRLSPHGVRERRRRYQPDRADDTA